jgi:hypothetical protein
MTFVAAAFAAVTGKFTDLRARGISVAQDMGIRLSWIGVPVPRMILSMVGIRVTSGR